MPTIQWPSFGGGGGVSASSSTAPTAYSALDFITRALRLLGVLQPDEVPDDDNAQDAFDTLNDWMDTLAIQRLAITHLVKTQKTLTAGTASYTIGLGGDIDLVRPQYIGNLGLIFDINAAAPIESPRHLITDDEWAGIAQKTYQSHYVLGAYYDHTWAEGLARLYPWPIPNVSTTALVLYLPTALTMFADMSTRYTFPPGYPRYIRTNLAVELAPDFGKEPSPQLLRSAVMAEAMVKRANYRPAVVKMDASLPNARRRGMTGSRFSGGEF